MPSPSSERLGIKECNSSEFLQNFDIVAEAANILSVGKVWQSEE